MEVRATRATADPTNTTDPAEVLVGVLEFEGVFEATGDPLEGVPAVVGEATEGVPEFEI